MNIESFTPEIKNDLTKPENSTDLNDQRLEKNAENTQGKIDNTDTNDKRVESGEISGSPEALVESNDSGEQYYSTLKERIDQTPREDSGLGTWEGERGNSKFIPSDAETKAVLERYGTDGIEYKNGVVDFSPVTLEKVQIEMGPRRLSVSDGQNRIKGNYEKADDALAAKWNSEKKDGREDWTKNDVEDWVAENKLVRHENNDMKTVSYMPFEPHVVCSHLGGVAECKKRDLILRGGFDE